MAEPDGSPTPSSWSKRLLVQLSNNFFVVAGGGSLLLAVGSIYMVAVLSTTAFSQAFDKALGVTTEKPGTDPSLFDGWFLFMLGITILGLIAAVIAFINQTPHDDEQDLSQYDYALVGLGFTLTLVGLLNFVALSGFALQGHLDQILIFDDAQKCTEQATNGIAAIRGSSQSNFAERADRNSVQFLVDKLLVAEHQVYVARQRAQNRCQIYQMVRLALMPGFAVLGSLFFVAGSLRQKRDDLEKRLWFKQREAIAPGTVRSPEEVDEDLTYRGIKFWGGLWYRMGEAILFALVVYILLKTVYIVDPGAAASEAQAAENSKSPGPGLLWLLALSLVIGMFVKPAEVLINGIGQRLFGAVKELTKS